MSLTENHEQTWKNLFTTHGDAWWPDAQKIFSSTWLFRDSGPERAPIAEAECDCQSVGRCTLLPQSHYTRHIATFMLYLEAQWYASFLSDLFFQVSSATRAGKPCISGTSRGAIWGFLGDEDQADHDRIWPPAKLRLQDRRCASPSFTLRPSLQDYDYGCKLLYASWYSASSCLDVRLCFIPNDKLMMSWCHDVMPIFVFSLDPGLQTGFHQDTFSEVQWVQWLQSFVPCVALWTVPGCCHLLFEWHCVHSGLQDSMFLVAVKASKKRRESPSHRESSFRNQIVIAELSVQPEARWKWQVTKAKDRFDWI